MGQTMSNRKMDFDEFNVRAINDIDLHNSNWVSSYTITYFNKTTDCYTTIHMEYEKGEYQYKYKMPDYLKENYNINCLK
jgi:hypothetical protein